MCCRTASCSDLIGGAMAFNGPSMVSSLDFQVCSCSFRIFNEFNEFVVQVSKNEINNEFEGEDHATLRRFIALPTCNAAAKIQEMLEYDTYNIYIYVCIYIHTDYTYALYRYIMHIYIYIIPLPFSFAASLQILPWPYQLKQYPWFQSEVWKVRLSVLANEVNLLCSIQEIKKI